MSDTPNPNPAAAAAAPEDPEKVAMRKAAKAEKEAAKAAKIAKAQAKIEKEKAAKAAKEAKDKTAAAGGQEATTSAPEVRNSIARFHHASNCCYSPERRCRVTHCLIGA